MALGLGSIEACTNTLPYTSTRQASPWRALKLFANVSMVDESHIGEETA